MASLSVNVPDANTILDLNVTVEIDHPWVGDLVIKLKGPSGQIVTLMSRPGLIEAADNGNGTSPEGSHLSRFQPIAFNDSAAKSAEQIGNTLPSHSS
jgi:subtilisin-like proprotein convertase family protein